MSKKRLLSVAINLFLKKGPIYVTYNEKLEQITKQERFWVLFYVI